MNMLASLKTDVVVEEEKDILGGGGFQPLDTDVYTFTINQAYMGEAGSGAVNVTLDLRTADGQTLRSTQYITSGTAKGKKTTYLDKDGNNRFLPGFTLINGITLLTIGKEIHELQPEEKVINLYNYEAGKELPTKVMMLTELLGQQITLGVVRQIVDKNVKDANGQYVPSGETREENEIEKAFRARDGMTVAEIKAQAEKASFIDSWKEKHAGSVRNKAKGAQAATGVAGAPKAAPAPGGTAAPAKSLFA